MTTTKCHGIESLIDPKAAENDRVADFFIKAAAEDGLLLPIYAPGDLLGISMAKVWMPEIENVHCTPLKKQPLTEAETKAMDRLLATITLLRVRTMLLKESSSGEVASEIQCTEAQAEAATRCVHTQCEKLRPKLLGYVSYPRSFLQENWAALLLGRNINDKEIFL